MEYKNQHYVTRSYLETFSTIREVNGHQSRSIWIYDRKTGVCKQKGLENVASRAHYYSFIHDGEYEPLLEKKFGEVETRGAEAIRSILIQLERFKTTGRFILSNLTHLNLVDFIYMHSMRVPAVFDPLRAKTKDFDLELSREHSLLPDEERQNNMALTVLVKLLATRDYPILEEFLKRNVFVMYTRKSVCQFITTDNPVVRFNKDGDNGVGQVGTEIWVPLAPTCLVVLINRGDEKFNFVHFNDSEEVERFNCFIAERATRYVFGHSYELVERIAMRNGWKFTKVNSGGTGDSGTFH